MFSKGALRLVSGTAVRVAHFSWARVQGAHIERDNKDRPNRTPSHAEMLQAERTGLSAEDLQEKITELWQRTDSGKAFAAALWKGGYVFARGDRRDSVVIDPNGGTHSLSHRVEYECKGHPGANVRPGSPPYLERPGSEGHPKGTAGSGG